MPKKKPAKSLRQLFFGEIGHRDEHHRAVDLHGDDRDRAAWVAAAARSGIALAVQTSGPNYCGWWWCSRAAEISDNVWKDLRSAGALLREDGVDPWDPMLIEIVWPYTLSEGWAPEKTGYELLHEALSLPLERDAERLRKKWLEELEPLLRNARIADPARVEGQSGNSVDHSQENALLAAKRHGLGPEHLAAIFVLTGTHHVKLESLKKQLRSAETRRVERRNRGRGQSANRERFS